MIKFNLDKAIENAGKDFWKEFGIAMGGAILMSVGTYLYGTHYNKMGQAVGKMEAYKEIKKLFSDELKDLDQFDELLSKLKK